MSRLLLWTSKLLIVSSMNLKIGRLIIIIYVGRGIEILTARCLETTLTWSKGNILHVRNAKSDQVSPIIEIYYINSDQGVKTWSCGLLPWVRLYNPMAVLNCTAKNEALNFFAAFLLYPGIADQSWRAMEWKRNICAKPSDYQRTAGKPYPFRTWRLEIRAPKHKSTYTLGAIQNLTVSIKLVSPAEYEHRPQKCSCKIQSVVLDSVRLAPENPNRGAILLGDTWMK